MPICNAGRDALCAAIIGEAGLTLFNTANAHIGVGDSTAAFAVTQTDLQAATNKFRKVMDAGFPTRAGNVITFRATFGPTEANFAWNELATFNSPTAGTMLSRFVSNQGTKTNTSTIQQTVTLTLTLA